MKYIKKFENFTDGDTQVKPAVKPTTKPETRPGKPTPIRRDKPSVDPKPKAGKNDKLPIASSEEVAERFIELLNDEGDDVKKYVTKK